jgi:selenocysteine lyase/cysteine desulfurase
MTTRRDFLKTASLASLSALSLPAVPGLAQKVIENAPPLALGLPDPADPAYWPKVRRLFLLREDKVFFNTGTLGAMPRPVFETIVGHLRQVAADIADWDYQGDDWITGYQPYPVLRAKLAALMNASPGEVSLVDNAHMGMNIVANGLDLEPGAEILGTDMEHAGGRYGWELKARRQKGVYRQVPLPKPARDPEEIVDVFRKAFTPKTRVLAVAHILSGTGAVLPVKALCAEARSRGIFTVIDGAQAIGHVKIDVRDIGCDVYYSSMHKWLFSPAGSGVLYIRGDRAKEIWTTLASGQWDNHEDEGYRFQQRGTGNLSLLLGVNAAVDFHNALGSDRVFARIKRLGDYLRAGLARIPKVKIHTPVHPALCAGITNYLVEGLEGTAMQDAMWAKGIRIRNNRQSTHIYNNEAEIDASLAVVRGLAG